MSAEKRKTNVSVLLISGQASDIHEVKDYLWKSADLAYHVEHRPDFFGSSDLLAKGNTSVDIILIDLGMFGSEHSREVFRRMVDMAHGIPIIVFTDRKDHDMAVLAMEDGAADNITRGELGTDIFKFRDSIAFAMARAEISKTLEDRNVRNFAMAGAEAAVELEGARQSSAENMDDQKNLYADMVKTIMERGEDDITQAVREISEALEHAKLENTILLAQLKKQNVLNIQADDVVL